MHDTWLLEDLKGHGGEGEGESKVQGRLREIEERGGFALNCLPYAMCHNGASILWLFACGLHAWLAGPFHGRNKAGCAASWRLVRNVGTGSVCSLLLFVCCLCAWIEGLQQCNYS